MVLMTLDGEDTVCNPRLSDLILPSVQEGFVGMAASASRGWGRVLAAGGDSSWWTEEEGGLYIPRWMGLGALFAGKGRKKCRRTGERVKHPRAQLPCFFWTSLAAHQLPLFASEKIRTQVFCYIFLTRTALAFLIVFTSANSGGLHPSRPAVHLHSPWPHRSAPVLTCLEKHEKRLPETTSYPVAFVFQVSWLKSQLDKYPSALCTLLHLCL